MVVLNLYLGLLIYLVDLVKRMIQIFLELIIFFAYGESACTWHSAVLATRSAAVVFRASHFDGFVINIKSRIGDVSWLFILVKLVLHFRYFSHKLIQMVINLM